MKYRIIRLEKEDKIWFEIQQSSTGRDSDWKSVRHPSIHSYAGELRGNIVQFNNEIQAEVYITKLKSNYFDLKSEIVKVIE